MRQYLHILQKELPSITEKDLNIPIKQTEIDSLDIVAIRVAVEKYFGIKVSDTVWYQYQTLSQVLEYFHNNKTKVNSENNTSTHNLTNTENVEIRMPQMANKALSESWLLKYLGDKHWSLLSEGFNRKSSEFTDDNGNRLYSTFIRINYSNSVLSNFQENEIVTFNSNIQGFGSNSFISSINGKSTSNEIRGTLLTTFSIRVNDNNNEINKGNIELIPNKICQLTKTPNHLNDYRLLRKGLIDVITSEFGSFPNTEDIVFSCEYSVNPYYDINGVGLLYFAAYPIISDSCCLKYYNDNKSYSYHTVYRDIFYFANCNSNDKLTFQLNYIDKEESLIKTLTTLQRQSDKKVIAKIITVKQMGNEVEL